MRTAAVAALATIVSPAIAAENPIYAAVQAYRLAEVASVKPLSGEPELDHPDYEAWLERSDRFGEPAADARIALLKTVPTTFAGLAAMLRYVSETDAGVCLLGSANENGTLSHVNAPRGQFIRRIAGAGRTNTG